MRPSNGTTDRTLRPNGGKIDFTYCVPLDTRVATGYLDISIFYQVDIAHSCTELETESFDKKMNRHVISIAKTYTNLSRVVVILCPPFFSQR